jgi:hypothetical protein
MKKQNLEMLQLLESIEVMLQNGNSIHPDSVIRGAIRIAIGMDQYGMPEGLDTPEKHEQYLKDIGLKKQTAVNLMANELLYLDNEFDMGLIIKTEYQIKRKSIIGKAKQMEKEQIIESYCVGCADITKDNSIFPRETSEQYYKETFKSE